MTLAQLVLGTPSASLLYHNLVWVSGAMSNMGLFIQNPNPQQTLIYIVTLVPMQPTVMNLLSSSVQVTHLVQSMVLSPTSISPSVPPVSAQAVTPDGVHNLNVSMVSGTTNVSSLYAHTVGVNQPSSGAIQNPLVLLDQAMSSTSKSKILLVFLGQKISSISSLMTLKFSIKLLIFHMAFKE